MDETRFGFILMESPFISSQDIERCLRIQAESEEDKQIGQILLEEGLITPTLLEQALAIQERRRRRLAQTDEKRKLPTDYELPEIEVLMQRAAEHGATDILLGVGRPPRARVCGSTAKLSTMSVDEIWMRGFLRKLMDRQALEAFDRSKKQFDTFRATGLGAPCRASLYHDSQGPAVVLRIYRHPVPSIQELGHHESVSHIPSLGRGLMLICGGAESGKSTTLASILQHLAREFAGHILVLQQQPEAVFDPGAAFVTRRIVGRHCRSLAAGLRGSFREDSDLIAVDGLQGPQATELALQAVTGNHLVIATMQAPSATAAIEKLIVEQAPDRREHVRKRLAANLIGVVYQDLVPREDGEGVSLAEEILVGGSDLESAILEERFDRLPQLAELCSDLGALPFDESLSQLVDRDAIAGDEAYIRARDKHRFLAAQGS